MAAHNLHNTLKDISLSGGVCRYYALSALEAAGLGNVSRLPVSIRIVLEAVLRNVDGKKVTEEHVRQLAAWQPNAARLNEIPFVVARVVLQDFTGVPLLADLAAMRNVAKTAGKNPKAIEPLVPVDLVVDHSVMIDFFGSKDALRKNMELEYQRNGERYRFMKWGMQAFNTFGVVPPGIGIVHQVNLEYLFRGVHGANKDGLLYPDTLVGTDSHTTMINGAGVVGWGVGGIEAEAGMLGQPVYFLTPDVIGVELKGALREGVTATDLVLTITELLRKEKVVGTFVEFFGAGAASLSLTDRATIANMAPEYGATMGFFPVDDETINYLRGTGRTEAEIEAFEKYFKAQGLYGMPMAGDIDYTRVVVLDLDSIVPSLAGPKRPQDRIELPQMKAQFEKLFSAALTENGFNKSPAALGKRFPTKLAFTGNPVVPLSAPVAKPTKARNEIEMIDSEKLPAATAAHIPVVDVGHGDVLIAAITSCTNTSNPAVLIAAGLLAKKAVERGLGVNPRVKTSFGPGSRVVPEYLHAAGLQPYLDELGFSVAAFGCTTCIGNAGDLYPEVNEAIIENDLIGAAVLSGNRNFEARIHPNLKANFLASPPLVVAFALAGRVNIDLSREALGTGKDGNPVFLKDIWPSNDEVRALMKYAMNPDNFRRLYADFTQDNALWNELKGAQGDVYSWPDSTYIARPPFFDAFTMQPKAVQPISNARALLVLGDSVTTDHISPAGSFKAATPAGQYLLAQGVQPLDFNSYGSRRGNHEVMIRGTFANVRVRNLMLPPGADGARIEGGYTLLFGKDGRDGRQTTVYDAAMEYRQRGTATIVFAGEEYGTGSSRDWAAKGTQLLGIRAVIARSFERIHRSNLVGMGVLPLQFLGNDSIQSLGITGSETFSIAGVGTQMKPQQDMTLVITRADASVQAVVVRSRIDTPIEVDYFLHGGILPYVLRQILASA